MICQRWVGEEREPELREWLRLFSSQRDGIIQPGLRVRNLSWVAIALFDQEEAKMKRKKLARRQNMAASVNLQPVPLP